ncbi:MAG: NAD(P)/FAD-dependent oxidoreductase [Halieaceae bacterium]|jgi:phytoene dehydrogenase-like protein|nr:NAD(P)/FAD-dependent oxidoreductase [Halieaceae bacterium]
MTESRVDVVVIGAGHNALACAAYLAKTGRRVQVLEARSRPGGAAATRAFADGFRVSSGAHLLTQLNPGVARELALDNHGLVPAAADLSTIALAPDDQPVVISGASVRGVSAADQAAYRRFHDQNKRFAKVLDGFFNRPLPSLVQRNWRDNLSLLQLGWSLKRLGKDDMQDLLRVGLINIYDVANEHFDSALLKAAVSMDGVLGAHMGPRSPNTVYGYLYRHMGDYYGMQGPTVVRGGMGAVGQAFAHAAEAAGAVLRCDAPVAEVLLENCRAVGVRLASGEVIRAGVVVSGADPKTTFNKLVGYRHLDAGFARRIENFRARGVSAKLHLALDGLPVFTGLREDQAGQRLLIAPSMDAIELAFNHAKYGEFSPQPVMEISIPTLHDDSLAPEGKHVLSAIVQFAPYQLRQGWAAGKEAFLEQVMAQLERYAPGIGEQVLAAELLTPEDLEAEFGMHGGHWHHGEIALDQALMMRPVPGAQQYATPVPGLYLCSAGSHPGGGVMGVAGRNAARVVMREEKSA